MEKTRISQNNIILEQVLLPQQELRWRYEKAVEADYWRELCPHAALGNSASKTFGEMPPADFESIDQTAAHLKRRGYFESRNVIPADAVASMRKCVETVTRAGWPAIFAFLYDDFWTVTRTPSVVSLLGNVLGADYRMMITRIWCYYVPPIPGAGGWAPHADDFANCQKTVTVWIALTDATLDNGCIYVVPRDLIYTGGPSKEYPLEPDMMPRDLYLQLLQCSRALPTPAGSVLGWDPQLIHWGSKCHAAGEPRISLACEFAGEDAILKNRDELFPAGPSDPLPPFEHRLRVIGRAIDSYQVHDVGARRFWELAKRLAEREGI